jgi:tripartite ATP-independent transporter DctP family solute receptor
MLAGRPLVQGLGLLFLLVLLAPGASEAQPAGRYKSEFKMSVVVNQENSWGRAAIRFADMVRYRTDGRIQIKPYFDGRMFADRQTTEFKLLQEGQADFAIGSTINWSPQVTQLNLFSLPFMFPDYGSVDAVQAGEPGARLFKIIEQKGVVPLVWGENGFRELTNSKRSVHRPEDLQGLRIRVVGIPIFVDIIRELGAVPISLNFGEALTAIRQGTVDGQENPIALIIPYKFWSTHRHVTLWRYAVDPLILAASAKTWASLSREDRAIVEKTAQEVMAVQKQEAREGLQHAMTLLSKLREVYGMEVVQLSRAEFDAFRARTRRIHDRWAPEVGIDLVNRAARIVDDTSR